MNPVLIIAQTTHVCTGEKRERRGGGETALWRDRVYVRGQVALELVVLVVLAVPRDGSIDRGESDEGR